MTKQMNKRAGPYGDFRETNPSLEGDIDHEFFDDDDDVVKKEDKHKSRQDTVPNKTDTDAAESKRSSPSDNSKSKNKDKDKSQKKSNQSKNDCNQKAQDPEKKERERREQERRRKEERERERREREVLEAERRERELEIERWERERDRDRNRARGRRGRGGKEGKEDGVLVSRYKPRRPPAGYKDPHDVCKQVLPTKVREEKRQEIKALMNCIAFDPVAQGDPARAEDRVRPKGKSAVEEMDNSLSSDTTSDITDVTPRSSSSGCSSMSKQSMNLEKNDKGDTAEEEGDEGVGVETSKACRARRSRSETKAKEEPKAGRKPAKKTEDNHGTEGDVNGNLTEVELEEMKYLQDAFEDLDIDEQASDFASSIISGLSEERRAKCGRKNMTFTNDQLREIERVNLILLKKIMGHRKPRMNSQSQPPVNRKTSAAINRAKMEDKIDRDNKILLKKLQAAKGTTGTFNRKAVAY